MVKKIKKILKKIIFSAFILYGYNVLVAPLNIIIPINLINVGLITLFGVPSLFSLIVIYLLVY